MNLLDSDLWMAVQVIARTNAVLTSVEATSRMPGETKRRFYAQKREIREFLNMIAAEHDCCPGCFQRPLADGKHLCAECLRDHADVVSDF